MIIGFIGDVHGRVFDALAAIWTWQRRAETRLDFIVQVGDMGAYPDPGRTDIATAAYLAVDPGQADFARLLRADGHLTNCVRQVRAAFTSPIHFLRGNHEDFRWLASLPVESDSRTAPVDDFDVLRYVPDGTLLDLDGLRLAFLGGVEELSGEPGIDRRAYEALMSLGPGTVDVLVTHEGPYGSSVGYRGDVHGSQMVTELLERLRTPFHVAGHAHQLSGPRVYGATTYLGLDGLLASPLWYPEARGLQAGCLGILDTQSKELWPVTDEWLQEFDKPFDFERWWSTVSPSP